jgi:hypothetical protein
MLEEPARVGAPRAAEPARVATPERTVGHTPTKPARTGETVVGPMPTQPAAQDNLPPTEPARKRTDVAAEPARVAEVARTAEPTPTRVPNEIPRSVEPRAPIRPAEPRADARPPHTPPGPRPATAAGLDSGPMAMSDLDADSGTDLERPRTSTFMTVLLVLLVLLATAVTAVSVVRKNTPDPRPLLEDVYRQLRG